MSTLLRFAVLRKPTLWIPVDPTPRAEIFVQGMPYHGTYDSTTARQISQTKPGWGNAYSSKLVGHPSLHLPLFDIDSDQLTFHSHEKISDKIADLFGSVPVMIPSPSGQGFHAYVGAIDGPVEYGVTWGNYKEAMTVLSLSGMIDYRWVEHSVFDGQGVLRKTKQAEALRDLACMWCGRSDFMSMPEMEEHEGACG